MSDREISDLLSERSLVALPTLKFACLSVPVRVDTHGDQTVIKVVAISSRGSDDRTPTPKTNTFAGILAIQASVIGC